MIEFLAFFFLGLLLNRYIHGRREAGSGAKVNLGRTKQEREFNLVVNSIKIMRQNGLFRDGTMDLSDNKHFVSRDPGTKDGLTEYERQVKYHGVPRTSRTVSEMAVEVSQGLHGNGHGLRMRSLDLRLSDYVQVMEEVNRRERLHHG